MSKAQTEADAVDKILMQWHKERPDLDPSPMAIIGRLSRCTILLARQLDSTFSHFGMTHWEFDMLATLRRSGAPYRLSPTELFLSMMITSGTMTHRLKVLEGRGWIERLPCPDDARSSMVQLTESGFALIEQAVSAHVQNEHAILAGLAAEDAAALRHGLVALLKTLEPST